MTVKLIRFDPSKYLETEEQIAGYLALAFEGGDMVHIKNALSDVAKARNMSEIARRMGITRRGLYKMLSEDGNPTFSNVQSLLEALDVKLSVLSRAA